MSEAVPVVLGPTTQSPVSSGVMWHSADAQRGKYSFSVDNSVSGLNFILNFGSNDTLTYQKTPTAVASLTLGGYELNNQILVTNYKESSSKIVTHALWAHKDNNGIPLDPSRLLEFVPDTGQERVVLDHLNIGVFSDQSLSLDESDFDIDLSQIDFKENSKTFFFNNFDSGDTLRLPSGYIVNKFENNFTNGIATVTLEIDASASNKQFKVNLVGVSSVDLDGMVYVAGSP
jgi:hypothetical protein